METTTTNQEATTMTQPTKRTLKVTKPDGSVSFRHTNTHYTHAVVAQASEGHCHVKNGNLALGTWSRPSYCGRYDLALKRQAAMNAQTGWTNATIVEVEVA